MQSTELIGWSNGFYFSLDEIKLVFDPIRKAIEKDTNIFVSHAHSDHTAGFLSDNPKHSILETKEIYESVTGNKLKNFKEMYFNKEIKFDDVGVTPLNAGHMLGSAMFMIRTPSQTLLYTGDINCVDTLITSRAERIKCDTLVIEGTYGNPYYVFPEREEVYAMIINWLVGALKKGQIPIFKVYSAGKAQELVRLFNSYTTVPVVTDYRINAICEIYKSKSHKLSYKVLNKDLMIPKMDDVYILVSGISTNLYLNCKSVIAKASGWLLNKSRPNMGLFPLSSHADFNQLIEFILETSAQKVYIYTGYAEQFSSYLRKKYGIAASPILKMPQRVLL